ncbi:hypothetical protein [Marinimicrobium locisalis]|uniref:hypothetical protein n=1 Tax=Marinimicrobium locisalis TaxID=546022 RepID=UPI003221B22F
MSQYQVIYTVNGQPVDVSEVPPQGIVERLHLDGERLVYGEDVRDNQLHAITCQGPVDGLEDAAREAITNAVNNDAPLELSDGVRVNVFFDPMEFNLQFDMQEGNTLMAKAQFIAFEGPAKNLAIQPEEHGPYVVEEVSEEPVMRVYRRAIYNSARELVCFEHPLFTLDPQIGLLSECGAFAELTPAGEQEMVQAMDEWDREALSRCALYFLPAFSEEHLENALPYLQSEQQALLSQEGQPIAPETIQSHEAFFVIGVNSDDTPRMVQNFSQQALAETDIYQVPVEMHWHVFHAYLKQLHETLTPIAMGDEVTHYVRVHSEGLSEALDGVEMEEGDRRIHTSVFHLSGSLVLHECWVVNDEGEPKKRYLMHSPVDFGLIDGDLGELDSDVQPEH